jgi:DNA mismatch repair protein MutS
MKNNKKDTSINNSDKGAPAALTPLMQQYREIKSRYPDMILLFRLGDFYEMFGEDAKKAAPILEVTLTRRQDYPMCGVPYHSVSTYLRKLIKAGEKVAVCEQLEEPKKGVSIVKRDVVRVITPGTVIEDNLLDSKKNNYLLAIVPDESSNYFGLAFIDISTGDFQTAEAEKSKLFQELFRISPCEIIVPESFRSTAVCGDIEKRTGLAISTVEDWLVSDYEASARIKKFFRTQSLKPFDLENKPLSVRSCGAILSYLEKTQPKLFSGDPGQISGIKCYSLDSHMLIDESAIRNLDLVESQNTRTKENSLLDAIDSTVTPMGSRLLRHWILRPLISVPQVLKRQNCVEYFVSEGLKRRQLREILKGVSDIERIAARIASQTASPRELVGLKNTLMLLPEVSAQLVSEPGVLSPESHIAELSSRLGLPKEILDIVGSAIVDEPPAGLKDGGVIKRGYNKELDELNDIRKNAKSFVLALEDEERKRTGINTLKIGYTSVFGYYIEITRSNIENVPVNYTRKQTLTNCERFITPELKTLEEKIITAEEKIIKLEDQLYKGVLSKIFSFSGRLKELAEAIAHIDIFASFAETSSVYGYCRPVVDNSYELYIKDGRHPVIERKLKSGTFVPNDINLNSESDQIVLLTGPNMAGKSTYLRQNALLCVLAQIGSSIPAGEARIGIIDRIFTRIGASDNISEGESTFMVEMNETANILHQFTPKSLIILDEVGRGTSTYDGISIANATLEYLAIKSLKEEKRPKVLFATHYFELTDLSQKYPWIKNYNVSVKEWNDEVVFLHKIIPGPADRSYGIHVARLAGMPSLVIKRAKDILKELEARHLQILVDKQMSFFESLSVQKKKEFVPENKIMIELDRLDIDNITPLEALKLIAEWKKINK